MAAFACGRPSKLQKTRSLPWLLACHGFEGQGSQRDQQWRGGATPTARSKPLKASCAENSAMPAVPVSDSAGVQDIGGDLTTAFLRVCRSRRERQHIRCSSSRIRANLVIASIIAPWSRPFPLPAISFGRCMATDENNIGETSDSQAVAVEACSLAAHWPDRGSITISVAAFLAEWCPAPYKPQWLDKPSLGRPAQAPEYRVDFFRPNNASFAGVRLSPLTKISSGRPREAELSSAVRRR